MDTYGKFNPVRDNQPDSLGPESSQKNCKYGYVLPDRCRYMAHKGCECGEYPPLKWNADKGQYENDTSRT